MTVFRKALPGERDQLIDFGNYVFSHDHRPHDFKAILPKVYGEGHEIESFHFVAEEEGRIRGMIGAYPHEYTVAGNTLKTRFIGTVSVHPYARGNGYMKKIMKMIDEELSADGTDYAALGGQRQRYRYFGYETGGIALSFVVDLPNLKHTVGPLDESISLVPVEADDDTLLDQLYAKYLTRPVTGRTRAEFYEVLITWGSRIYAVFENVACIGYLVLSEDGRRVMETQLDDVTRLPDVLNTYLNWYDKHAVTVHVRRYETALIDVLTPLAEDVSIENNLSYKIYNYPKVLKAFLELKQQHEVLEDGAFVLEVEGKGKMRIEITEGKVTVVETEDPSDWVLTETEAVRYLTSPEPLFRNVLPAFVPRSWFPLSYGMSALDEF